MQKLYAEADSATRAKMAPRLQQKKAPSKMGRPLSREGMMRWSDVTTPRWPTVVENLLANRYSSTPISSWATCSVRAPFSWNTTPSSTIS